jgi:hypothetical protein
MTLAKRLRVLLLTAGWPEGPAADAANNLAQWLPVLGPGEDRANLVRMVQDTLAIRGDVSGRLAGQAVEAWRTT